MLARKYEGKALFTISETTPKEYRHILNLQRFANNSAAQFEVMCDEAKPGKEGWKSFKATSGKLIVASLLAKMDGKTCRIRQLAIHPFYRDKAPEQLLFNHMQKVFPEAESFRAMVFSENNENIKAFENAGFKKCESNSDSECEGFTYLMK